MAYEQGYAGDPRGREEAVADEGAADIGSDLLDSSFAESTSGMTLNEQKVENKLSFYLDEDQFGATYSGSPYNANININREGHINWGGSISQGVGPFSARVGLVGQGSNISPYANLNVNPVKGLNLNVSAQSYPGGYSAVNPSASYQNEFNTPWGPLGYNIGRRGGRTTGGLQVRGDF
jgi:hypothetical protein